MRPRAAAGSSPSRVHGSRLQKEPIPGLKPFGGTRRELDDDLRALAPGRLPWLQVALHTQDDEVAVAEDRIDRKAHEHHVNRSGRAEEHPFLRAEAGAAEQATHPRQRRIGDFAARTDDLAARLSQQTYGHPYPFLAICTDKAQETSGGRV